RCLLGDVPAVATDSLVHSDWLLAALAAAPAAPPRGEVCCQGRVVATSKYVGEYGENPPRVLPATTRPPVLSRGRSSPRLPYLPCEAPGTSAGLLGPARAAR